VIRDRASEGSVWNYKSPLDARIHRYLARGGRNMTIQAPLVCYITGNADSMHMRAVLGKLNCITPSCVVRHNVCCQVVRVTGDIGVQYT